MCNLFCVGRSRERSLFCEGLSFWLTLRTSATRREIRLAGQRLRKTGGTLARALAFGRCGVILTFTWHWFSSLGGWDKSFYSRTEFDPERVLQDGTPERTAFYRDPDVMAEHLKPFLLEDIPIWWRPFHESAGIGSGGVKKVRRWRRGFSVCSMSILWENMVYIIFCGWGTASLWKGSGG